jgi:hypothetical protein
VLLRYTHLAREGLQIAARYLDLLEAGFAPELPELVIIVESQP